MKKHLLFFGTLLVLGTVSTQANAAGNRYISAHGGVSSVNHFNVIVHDTGLPHGNITTSPGLALAVAAGKRIDDCRVEVEFGYQRNNADNISINTPHGTINADLQGYFSITTFRSTDTTTSKPAVSSPISQPESALPKSESTGSMTRPSFSTRRIPLSVFSLAQA